jgi:hypothetical protein
LTGLRKNFAVRRIVAFEAKISDWRGAIQQAALNKWFASESYILVPRIPARSVIIETAEAAGVGVWIEGEVSPYLVTPRVNSREPLSYASWLFNEWSWRFARNI